jgi:hypothetical protein
MEGYPMKYMNCASEDGTLVKLPQTVPVCNSSPSCVTVVLEEAKVIDVMSELGSVKVNVILPFIPKAVRGLNRKFSAEIDRPSFATTDHPISASLVIIVKVLSTMILVGILLKIFEIND